MGYGFETRQGTGVVLNDERTEEINSHNVLALPHAMHQDLPRPRMRHRRSSDLAARLSKQTNTRRRKKWFGFV
jgi:hypothetical protein